MTPRRPNGKPTPAAQRAVAEAFARILAGRHPGTVWTPVGRKQKAGGP